MHETRVEISKALHEHVEYARELFLSLINSSNLESTAGSCLYSCVYLKKYLEKFTDVKSVIIRGGSKDCGVKIDGEWRGHYWCEGLVDDCIWIFDITIDQFVSLPFICEQKDNLLIEYKAGSQKIADQDSLELNL